MALRSLHDIMYDAVQRGEMTEEELGLVFATVGIALGYAQEFKKENPGLFEKVKRVDDILVLRPALAERADAGTADRSKR